MNSLKCQREGIKPMTKRLAMVCFMTVLFIGVSPPLFPAQTHTTAPRAKTKQPETSHLVFVTEYVRELAAIENIRESAEMEQKQEKDDPSHKILDSIHASTMFQLELQSQINMLRGMRLNPPFDFLIPAITGFYQQKVQIWQKLVDTGSTFLAGPKPGVDYGKLEGEVPKLRAQLDFIDKTLFEASASVFATLIDVKEDSQHHANHLIISKEERLQLLERINTDFGSKLDEKNQNMTVSSAIVLRGYLLQDFKSSDEPWD
jgi:hypothetical protein